MMVALSDLAILVEGAAPAAEMEPETEPKEFIQLADEASAMVWMADASGLCTYANRRWLEFCGRTLSDETGTGWAEGIHPDDGLTALSDYWIAFQARLPVRIQYRVLSKDAQYHAVERLGWPWFSKEGALRGYLGCITLIYGPAPLDIEARQRLARLSARERQLLDLIAAGHSTRKIAEQLGISYKTADSHRTHLLRKLGLHESASLVRFAIRAGVIKP